MQNTAERVVSRRKATAIAGALLALLLASGGGCEDRGRRTGFCKDGTMVSAPSSSKLKKVCESHGGVSEHRHPR